MSLEAMRRRTSPMDCWIAERSSGSGRSKVDRRPRRWCGSAMGFRVVWVVAEVFSAQAGAAAAVAVGEDVAALVLFGVWCGVLHGWGPSPVKSVQSLPKK